jgi:hypothetical protein
MTLLCLAFLQDAEEIVVRIGQYNEVDQELDSPGDAPVPAKLYPVPKDLAAVPLCAYRIVSYRC